MSPVQLPPELPGARPYGFEFRITPEAWAKIIVARDTACPNEVSGFGVLAAPGVPTISDFVPLTQVVTGTYTRMLGSAIEAYNNNCIEKELDLNQHCRIWIHTHPGFSPMPLSLDEQTWRDFLRLESPLECRPPWMLMGIVSTTCGSYWRLGLNSPFELPNIPVSVTLDIMAASRKPLDLTGWQKSILEAITPKELPEELPDRYGGPVSLDELASLEIPQKTKKCAPEENLNILYDPFEAWGGLQDVPLEGELHEWEIQDSSGDYVTAIHGETLLDAIQHTDEEIIRDGIAINPSDY